MSIVLSKIYTRAGDEGTTALGDMSRTSKTDPRIDAYAAVDEANAALGVVLALGNPEEDVATVVRWVQNDLFDVGSDLCRPPAEGDERSRVDDGYVKRLEAAIDRFNDGLPALRSFILPGGTPAAALLHVARTSVRSAERRAWALIEAVGGEQANKITAQYLNRAADLLFVLARVANREVGDVTWTPGENRGA
ncbi:cob(I)yrinic acid a,c-diamide adenosyltransferase [Actinokineospora auranticolor]|uniref:Corrinoid adenosyltransferase n=1 Tax=Actinokineospora auranticolor TaxID=155976 RepID=A0A2S6GTR8_9PSEU|nr:cob(I)yrinic acid a,c-diamide adenosyltransferase [Actinokineospora auranticolor]PPK68583.1 cob(I)alamin adenosyltransferase [Actinokineospora auranticolor]